MKRLTALTFGIFLAFLAGAQVTTNPGVTGVFNSASPGPIGATSPSTGKFTTMTVTGLTATRVPFATTGGLLTDAAAFTFTSGTGTLAATTFSGALSGNASTATALASDPTDCGANTFANAINASGTLSCAAVPVAATSGFGTIATQAADNVAITGGSISGMTTNVSTSGVATTAATVTGAAQSAITSLGTLTTLAASASSNGTPVVTFTNTSATAGHSLKIVSAGTGAGTEVIGVYKGTSTLAFNVLGSGAVQMPALTTGTNADTVCMASDGTLLIQAAACTISSLRFKTDVAAYEDSALDKIALFEPITFRMRPGDKPSRDANAGRLQIGLAAENVAAVDSKLAIYEDDGVTPKSYRQEAMIALLVKAVQEQQAQIKALKAELTALRPDGRNKLLVKFDPTKTIH